MRGIFLILSLAVVFSLRAAEDGDATWSPVDNSLRARFVIETGPAEEWPFYRVFLEIQNTQSERHLVFNMRELTYTLTDKDGHVRPQLNVGSYDNFIQSWREPLILPLRSTLRFQISSVGPGFTPTEPGAIDLCGYGMWNISQASLPLYLSGTLTIPKDPADTLNHHWSGTLVIPPAEVPRQKYLSGLHLKI